ncbi:UDP-glycosyltransferase UGT5-like isoform X2 [Artemia franciscana]
MDLKCLLLLFIANTFYAECARILAATLVATKSHKFFLDIISAELAKRGHLITILSPYISKHLPNVTDIVFEELSSSFEDGPWFTDIVQARSATHFSLTPLSDIVDAQMERIIRTVLESQEFRMILNTKFDLLMVDTSLNDFLLPIAFNQNLPVVYIAPTALPSWIRREIGSPVYHANNLIVAPPSDDIFSRIISYISTNIHEIDYHYFLGSRINKHMINFYPQGYKVFPIQEMLSKIDLTIVNNHHSFGYPETVSPNIINAGGIHCKLPQSLVKDIEEFISDGDEGVILFSLGSAIPSEQMPKQYLDAFANAFRRLPQKIIWRWSGEPFENVPENVMLRSWLPQQDIAGHPKTRLLISHGGMLSTTEAICHGIPILGLPFWGDQDANIALAVRDGYGLKLEWNDLTEDLLYNTITELLNNTQYTRIVKKRQELFHDRPMKPLDEAVYWVEHILRHGGGQHLSPATRNLNRFQAKMLDVYLFLLGAVSIILILIAGSLYALLSIVRRFISPQLKQKLN